MKTSARNDNTVVQISGADIAASTTALPFGELTVPGMAVSSKNADIVVTGVTSVVLWGTRDKAIMRLIVGADEPLTMKQLVRALQCGYLVSAQTACKWGQYKDMIRENVPAGCRISTDLMPHQVDYAPTWKLPMAHGLPLLGYSAVLNDDGQLDVMLDIKVAQEDIAA